MEPKKQWQSMTIPERMEKVKGLHPLVYGANWHEISYPERMVISDSLQPSTGNMGNKHG